MPLYLVRVVQKSLINNKLCLSSSYFLLSVLQPFSLSQPSVLRLPWQPSFPVLLISVPRPLVLTRASVLPRSLPCLKDSSVGSAPWATSWDKSWCNFTSAMASVNSARPISERRSRLQTSASLVLVCSGSHLTSPNVRLQFTSVPQHPSLLRPTLAFHKYIHRVRSTCR